MSLKSLKRLTLSLIGILLFFSCYLINDNFLNLLNDVLKDFGVIFLSFIILEFIWTIAGEDFSKTMMAKYGLKNIYDSPRGVSDSLLIKQIDSAEEEIDLLGYTLIFISRSQDICKALEKKIISGVRVRIVLLSLQNPILNDNSNFKYLEYPQKAINDLKFSVEMFEKLKNRLNCDNFELLFIENRPISFSLQRFDDEMMVVPYITNINTIDSPVLVLKGRHKILFKKYINSFEDLLNKND